MTPEIIENLAGKTIESANMANIERDAYGFGVLSISFDDKSKLVLGAASASGYPYIYGSFVLKDKIKWLEIG